MTATLARRTLVEPNYWTCPHGVRVRPEPALTYGPEVAELCAKACYTPDPQQELGLDLIFAIRPDGSPASFAFCVICARQNLKSGLFLQSVIGWLFVLDDVPEIAWSSHELRTSLNAQAELERILDTPALSKYLPATQNAGKYDTNGKERQELNTGQTVWFQTRTRDGSRGLGKPKVIIDEAFKFKKRVAGAILPILLAQHHPQVLYGSSAPPLDEDAASLRDLIDRGRNHKSPSLSYIEWLAKHESCADPDCTHPKDAMARGIDCALDREHLIREANPTLTTGRITLETLRNLRQELFPDEYMRECLGWMDEEGSAGPPKLNTHRWMLDASEGGLRKHSAAAPTQACVVIYTQPDQSLTSLGVAGVNSDGERVLLQHSAPSEDWVVDRLIEVRKNVKVLEVALHPSGQAKTLIPAITAAGIEYQPLTVGDLGAGCSTLITKAAAGDFVHLGQTDLDAAAAVARTRYSGETQLWDVAGSTVPLAPLVAVSTALYRFELVAAEALKDPPPDIF